MVEQIGVTTGGNQKNFQGLSTDTKPDATQCGAGSTFYELDTKVGYDFSPNNINPATSNNWWVV